MARLLKRLSPLAPLTALALTSAIPACVDVDTGMPHETLVKDWRDEIIYQVMIDRFEDGDQTNNWDVDYRTDVAFHGGDWQGLIDRLDYIEKLGVTALWISPVVKNVENDAGFYSYHGYWTQNFTAVNPHFGDLAKLKELVRKCHERNIKVILDIVTNHVGQLFYYDINRNGSPDDGVQGGGGAAYQSQNQDQPSGMVRVSEWDPDYDARGIQGVTSLGENGVAPLRWLNWPNVHRIPPEPEEFANFDWFNARGRVTVWEAGTGRYLDACAAAGNDRNSQYCQNYAHRRLREQEILGDFPGGLKDLATARDDVRQALINAFSYWIDEADFDGFRIDTLKHQEPGFFEVFAPGIRQAAKDLGKNNFFMFGEAFDGNDELLGEYTQGQGVDSVFYFSAKYQIFGDVFGYGTAATKVARLYRDRNATFSSNYDDANFPNCDDEESYAQNANCTDPSYPRRTYKLAGLKRYNDQPKVNGPVSDDGSELTSQQLLVHFMDNHDVARILYTYNEIADNQYPDLPYAERREDAKNRMRNALTFLLTTDGVPCIYYGTEQDFQGGPDPANREDMWNTGFDTTGTTFQHTAKLTHLRQKYAPLRRGNLVFRAPANDAKDCSQGCGSGERCSNDICVPNGQPDALLAFERNYNGQTVLVMINTSMDKDAKVRSYDGQKAMQTGFPGGSTLVDVLNNQSTTLDSNGGIDVEIEPRSARIFVLEGQQ